MRLNILAFAAGIIALQMQPELPPAWPWALAGLTLGEGVGSAVDAGAGSGPGGKGCDRGGTALSSAGMRA